MKQQFEFLMPIKKLSGNYKYNSNYYLDIPCALTAHRLDIALNFTALFDRDDFKKIIAKYNFDIDKVKKLLGINGEYVHFEEENGKDKMRLRESVISLPVEEMGKRAKKIYDKLSEFLALKNIESSKAGIVIVQIPTSEYENISKQSKNFNELNLKNYYDNEQYIKGLNDSIEENRYTFVPANLIKYLEKNQIAYILVCPKLDAKKIEKKASQYIKMIELKDGQTLQSLIS